jgi:hypothetical protein
MTNEASYFGIWETILWAIRARISEETRAYGLNAQAVEVIEQPARTVVIRTNNRGGALVQASISLQGESIEITRRQAIGGGQPDDEHEVIEIQIKDGVVSYLHDDIDRTTSPAKVAEIILNPILDALKAMPRAQAQTGKS